MTIEVFCIADQFTLFGIFSGMHNSDWEFYSKLDAMLIWDDLDLLMHIFKIRCYFYFLYFDFNFIENT